MIGPFQLALDHRSARTLAFVVGCLLGFAAAPPLVGQDVPVPPDGGSAAAVLALLEHNRGLCDGIAGKVIGQWRRLGDSEAAERRVRDRVATSELSDMAAARATSDMIRSLLPRTRAEAGTETAASLGRLYEHVKDLCDVVALPTAPLEAFEARVGEVLDHFDRERSEQLGRLLVVPPEELAAALEPYLTAIQLAGFEAEAEYLEYLDSKKKAPPVKTLQQWMQEWHQRYAQAVHPTKSALGKYLQARNANDFRAMGQACKEILAAVIPLLRDEAVFRVPTPQVPASLGIAMEPLPPLYDAYKEIKELAVDCSAGRSREVENHFSEMQRQLQVAAGHLAKFSLAP